MIQHAEPVATMTLKLTRLAIQRKLNDPRCVVECDSPMLGVMYWRRIQAVRCDSSGPFTGMYVQEFGGLSAWYKPKAARWRLLQAGEQAIGGNQRSKP